MKNDLGPLFKMLQEMANSWSKPVWSVYAVWNHTRFEVYFGISMDPADRINQGHARGGTKAISHWNFESENLSADVIGTGMDGSSASALAHRYEDMGIINGYLTIQTRGK